MAEEEKKDINGNDEKKIETGSVEDDAEIVAESEQVHVDDVNPNDTGDKTVNDKNKEDIFFSPTRITDDATLNEEGAVGYRRPRSSSSESSVAELKAAKSPDYCILSSEKLVVFQRYFHESGVIFFSQPERRRRHHAGNQTRPVEIKDLQQALGQSNNTLEHLISYGMNRKPTINQAGAVIGYPERMPTAQEIMANKNDIVICDKPYDTEHSLGSAETVPIDEVYTGIYTPVSHRSGSADGMSSAGASNIKVSSDEKSSTSDSLLGACGISPTSEDTDFQRIEDRTRRRKYVLSPPMNIPYAGARSKKGNSSSYRDNFHTPVSRESSSDYEPYVSTYIRDSAIIPKRKISKDSSSGSEKNPSLSTESSVDLEMYMTVKPSTDTEEGSARMLEEFRLGSSLPVTGLMTDPMEADRDICMGISNLNIGDMPLRNEPESLVSGSSETNVAGNPDENVSSNSPNILDIKDSEDNTK